GVWMTRKSSSPSFVGLPSGSRFPCYFGRWAAAPRPNDRSILGFSLPSLQLLSPFGCFFVLVPGCVEVHQPLQSLGEADPGVPGDLALAFLHSLVTPEQERLGVGELLLAQKCATQK